MSLRPGFYGGVSNLSDRDDLLASTEVLEIRGVLLDSTAEDSDSPLGVKHLRRGLLLGKLTANDQYVQFDAGAADGSEVSADVYVLLENVDMTDAAVSGEPVGAAAVLVGTLNDDAVYVAGATLAALTQADVQRLKFVERGGDGY